MSDCNLVKILCFYDEIWPFMSEHAPSLKFGITKGNQVTIYAVMRIVQRHHKDIYLCVFGISAYLSGELWSFLARIGILEFRKSVILHQTSSNKIIYAIKL